ncbi:LysM peptidoglycan-binding domain-containing protein [Blastococcus deserti]|uniref:LysM peptidoglycan-binding domain-containing protein n=1 Tax=Blastococcus deserti TaxID=2259033 RepID=A0ABW4X5N8_9ACTN
MMSIRRLVVTGAAMALVALGLSALTPAFGDMAGSLASPQRTVDIAGPDALVVAAAGVLAWGVWSWGVLGLTLTAASAVPGMVGGIAGLATRVVLPAGARRSAALLLGLGLGVTAPSVLSSTVLPTPAVAAAPATAVPDWPAASASSTSAADTPAPGPATPSPAVPPATAPGIPVSKPEQVPDWPGVSAASGGTGSHVVVRGDCLWHVAAARLLEQSDRSPTDGEIARAVHAWWTANADVIGPDPDRLLPGQVLRPPGPA